MEACKAFLAEQTAFTVDFTEIAVLRQEKMIAALAARESLMEEIHHKLAPNALWTPHTELLRDDMMDLGWVKTAMAGMFQPFTATISRMEFLENGAVIDGVDLKEAQA